MSGTALLLPMERSSRRTPLSVGDAFALVVPMLLFIQVRTVGLLYATDIIFLLAAPIIVARGLNRLMDKRVLTYLTLNAAWFLSQVVTDIARESPSADYMRGWSKIGFTLIHFVVIWLLLRQSARRFLLFGIGLGVGCVLSTVISPSELAQENPWKYGYGIMASFLCVIALTWILKHTQSKTLFVSGMTALAALNVYMGFRSLAGGCLMSMAYSYFQLSSAGLRRRVGNLRLVIASCVLTLTGWGLFSAYGFGAQQGWFGKEAESKYRLQARGAGVLLGGRSEIFASSAAIIDSPIIGHGSWAKDMTYVSIMRIRQAEFGYRDTATDPKDEGLIPTHSHLFGAWVEAGLAGALFWFWVLWITVRALRNATGREPMLPVFAFIAFQLLWDTLFSPYGADQRFVATYSVAAMLILDTLAKSIKIAEQTKEVLI